MNHDRIVSVDCNKTTFQFFAKVLYKTLIVTQPVGSPASITMSPSMSDVRGVCSGGFSTRALPAARAWAILKQESMKGKFQGVIAATTPTGSYLKFKPFEWKQKFRSQTGSLRYFLYAK